jgi:23S rRNA pseudouridine955/2504/2580 synthase
MKGLEILYEDDDCLVINKPTGLPVQGGKNAAVNLDALLSSGWKPRPLLVHRLDKDTSGVILTAKSPAAAAYFSREFAGKRVKKQYLALCFQQDGAIADEAGTISASLVQNGALKKAVTHYKCIASSGIAYCGGFALLQLELGTGRMHQIRRHLAQNRLPITGDDKYGDFTLNKRFRGETGIKKMLLHASRLAIPLRNGHILDITAPLPTYFNSALAAADIKFDNY